MRLQYDRAGDRRRFSDDKYSITVCNGHGDVYCKHECGSFYSPVCVASRSCNYKLTVSGRDAPICKLLTWHYCLVRSAKCSNAQVTLKWSLALFRHRFLSSAIWLYNPPAPLVVQPSPMLDVSTLKSRRACSKNAEYLRTQWLR